MLLRRLVPETRNQIVATNSDSGRRMSRERGLPFDVQLIDGVTADVADA
jgi:hypothetical protein